MKQKQIKTVNEALDQSTLNIAGATDLGAGGLKQNTAAAITADRAALLMVRDSLDVAKTDLKTRQAALEVALAGGKAFALAARDMLKKRLGNQYSTAWDVAGFVGSIQIPESLGNVKVTLERLGAYFTANPTHGSVDQNVTAETAQTLFTELVAAQNAVKAQKAAVRTLQQTRDTKFTMLKRRLRGVVKELGDILDPLDARWETFGLNKPGAKQIPGVPENVIVTLLGGGRAVVSWKASARAEHYRLWMKVNGVDQEMQSAGSTAGVDFTIEGLPANAAIEIAVSAVNNGGESAKSAVVTVTTH